MEKGLFFSLFISFLFKGDIRGSFSFLVLFLFLRGNTEGNTGLSGKVCTSFCVRVPYFALPYFRCVMCKKRERIVRHGCPPSFMVTID